MAWDALAIIYYLVYVRKRPIPQEALDVEAIALAAADPTPEEKAKLDKEYKLWRIISYSFSAIAILLFVVSWL